MLPRASPVRLAVGEERQSLPFLIFSPSSIILTMRYVLPFLLLWGSLWAQSQVVAGEWFFDGPDPGLGQANAFAAFSPDTSITASDQIDLSALAPGLHRWNVRVQDDRGVWSHTYTRSFLLLPRDSASDLAGGEWFWDEDPGLGQGQPLTQAGQSDSLTWIVALDTLPAGIHHLYVRVKDQDGIWSHTYRRGIYVAALPDAPIERLTYYYRGPDSNSATFTYNLSQPQHYVDLSFNPEAGDLQDSVSYDLCITAVRTDSVVSCEQCETFLYRREDNTGGGGGDTTTSVTTGPSAGMRLYPNPNRGQFEVQLPALRQQKAHLQVFDAQGRQVYAQTLPPQDARRVAVHLARPVAGMYFVVVEAGTSMWTQRMRIE